MLWNQSVFLIVTFCFRQGDWAIEMSFPIFLNLPTILIAFCQQNISHFKTLMDVVDRTHRRDNTPTACAASRTKNQVSSRYKAVLEWRGFKPYFLIVSNFVESINLKLLTRRGWKLMGVEGLEPSTLRLRVTCSNQLSYTPASLLR